MPYNSEFLPILIMPSVLQAALILAQAEWWATSPCVAHCPINVFILELWNFSVAIQKTMSSFATSTAIQCIFSREVLFSQFCPLIISTTWVHMNMHIYTESSMLANSLWIIFVQYPFHYWRYCKISFWKSSRGSCGSVVYLTGMKKVLGSIHDILA